MPHFRRKSQTRYTRYRHLCVLKSGTRGTHEKIAIDMDEVIADALSSLLNSYNAEFDEALTTQHFQGQELREAIPPERHARISDYLLADGFFRQLDVMPDSQTVIAALSERYEVFITTAAMEFPTSFTAKYEWLREHFPFIPDSRIVFCGDKSIIQADYLIDDRSRHFERFVGQGILFSAPHNVAEQRYPRVDTWQDVAALFLQTSPDLPSRM